MSTRLKRSASVGSYDAGSEGPCPKSETQIREDEEGVDAGEVREEEDEGGVEDEAVGGDRAQVQEQGPFF